MRRGQATIEWAVVAVLQRHGARAASMQEAAEGLDTIAIAKRIYRLPLKPMHEVSVRRALATLDREGLVIDVGGLGHQKHWRAAPTAVEQNPQEQTRSPRPQRLSAPPESAFRLAGRAGRSGRKESRSLARRAWSRPPMF